MWNFFHRSLQQGVITFALLISSPLLASQTALLIDADTANEIDDLFAIVRAVRAPEFNLVGVSAAQFHTSPYASQATAEESLRLNRELMKHLNCSDVPLTLGSNLPLQDINSAQDSEAAQFIISQAHQSPTPLHLVILGSATNVASALLLDPSIASKIKVFYLGFWHNITEGTFSQQEFNSRNDPIAVQVLLDHPTLDLTVMTATTSQHLVFHKTKAQKQLAPLTGIGAHLMQRWNTYKRWWTDKDPNQTQWTMWDVALISALAHPEWAQIKEVPSPSKHIARTIKVFTHIDSTKMEADFWEHLRTLRNGM